MTNSSIVELFDELIQDCRPAFAQQRTLVLWSQLMSGWLLTTARHTITGMMMLIDIGQRHTHHAYHRLLRKGAWSMSEVFRVIAVRLVALLPPTAVIPLSVDDTLARHVGPQVAGAGWYRDPVRSTKTKTVHAHGLTLVILAVLITPPWGGPPVALPINMRVVPKGGPATHFDLLDAMLQEVFAWFPTRHFRLVGDGAFASYAAAACMDTRVTLTSRLRRDANVYALPTPNPKGKRGPKPRKGAALPTPEQMAAAPALPWQTVEVRRGARLLTRWVATCVVIRKFTLASKQEPVPAGKRKKRAKACYRKIRVLIVRDPEHKEDDDFFFTTEVDRPVAEVVTAYGDRWPIEVTIRDDKQLMGLEEPQCWKEEGPARAAGLGLWQLSCVWYLVLVTSQQVSLSPPQWYRHKRAMSFADALAIVRTALWARELAMLSVTSDQNTIFDRLIACLARAA